MALRFDPKLIEDFLLSLDNVVDASVWVEQGHIHAHLTPQPGVIVDPQTVMTRCIASLGPEHAPEDILIL